MSKSSDLDKTVKAYIIDHIEWDGYDITEPTTDEEKVQWLKVCFMQEYGWRVEQAGPQRAFSEWLQGLPTACTVAFTYMDILELAVAWGSIPENATECQEQKILDNWFNLIAAKSMQLFRKYGVMKS